MSSTLYARSERYVSNLFYILRYPYSVLTVTQSRDRLDAKIDKALVDLDILTEQRRVDHRRIVAAVVEEEQENQVATRQAVIQEAATQQAVVRYLSRGLCAILLISLVVFLAYGKF